MSEENENYQQYEKLLFERDKYKKQAGEYLRDYIREFGELLTEVFRKKISCIEKKKMINYCQQRLNRNEMIDVQAMSEYIRCEMEEYNEQKKIHPDIHPGTLELPVLSDLWVEVMDAYERNDLKALEELEIQINSILRELGDDVPDAEIPDVDEKISALEAEIEKILSTDPYQYRFLLEEEEKVQEYKEELQEELDAYSRYEKQLIEILKKYVAGGAKFTWEN